MDTIVSKRKTIISYNTGGFLRWIFSDSKDITTRFVFGQMKKQKPPWSITLAIDIIAFVSFENWIFLFPLLDRDDTMSHYTLTRYDVIYLETRPRLVWHNFPEWTCRSWWPRPGVAGWETCSPRTPNCTRRPSCRRRPRPRTPAIASTRTARSSLLVCRNRKTVLVRVFVIRNAMQRKERSY